MRLQAEDALKAMHTSSFLRASFGVLCRSCMHAVQKLIGYVLQAEDALKAMHTSSFLGRQITVEYVTNEDPHAKLIQRAGEDYPSRGRSPAPRARYG
jgi:hypothetical protein